MSKVGGEQMSFSRWTEKNVVFPHIGILFKVKKKWALVWWKDMKEFKCILQCKGGKSEIWYLGESKAVETLETSGIASGLGGGKDR